MKGLTDGQHALPQHVSPGLQYVSPQQLELWAMQKGAIEFEAAMQQVSGSCRG